MIVLLATIPLMIIGIAIATVPVVLAMVRDERQRRAELATATPVPAYAADEPLRTAA